ncbi:hypothetical protein TW65_00415 [Stemphylium lycopersici]|uniref:Rhodopsin domain-containing protein n=1 Tax=Stemphylium lycopersici TaxID=183478 RepID=A0A364N8W1_STELY|nr:hypothetical protein TW65_00415 [Stemphylium lycopersici]RAR13722.1 hypothetical protein DDE83_002907 [Stemphylium lycopersici]
MYFRPGLVVVIVGAILTSLSTIVVALRLVCPAIRGKYRVLIKPNRYYCRYFLMGSLSASDHLMFTALEKRPEIEPTVRGVLVSWWLYRLIYVVGLGFIKLSILFFYRSIAANRTFRRLVYGMIAFVSIYTFAATIAAIFQCQNPASAWSTTNYFAQFDPSIQREPAKCWDPVQLWVFSSAANLLSDIIILMLPLPTLLSLRIPMGKRLALIGIFSVGIMAIAASSVRMWVMMLWAESPWNSARYGSDLLLWGQVETNSGIISASVPFLRLLFHGKHKKEERSATPRKAYVTPPTPPQIDAFSQHKALDMGEWPLPNEKGIDRGEYVGFITIHERTTIARESNWGPFITIPESLSGSRSSAQMERTQHPQQMV